MIFIDTWGFKAFIDKREEKHSLVDKYIKDLWENKIKIITSDYIVDETITLLSYKLDYEKVKTFIENFELSVERNYIHMIRVSIVSRVMTIPRL